MPESVAAKTCGLGPKLSSVHMQVGFETEGTAIFDTMQYVTNEVLLTPAITAKYMCPPRLATSSQLIVMLTAILASQT